MLKSLINSHTLLRVESERSRQEVDCLFRGMWEKSWKWSSFSDRQRADVITRTSGSDGIELVETGCSYKKLVETNA